MIRRALAEDAPALTALMRASAAYRGVYASILDGYEITKEQIQSDHMFVATDDSELVLGFYSLAKVTSEPELDLMFVADAAQGSGIGAALFEHMRDTARRLGLASVTVVSHPPAAPFYARMGAELAGSKPPSGKVGWERPILVLKVEAPSDNSFEPKPLRGPGLKVLDGGSSFSANGTS
jgi:GNAT superfamily N-acetyltransferase